MASFANTESEVRWAKQVEFDALIEQLMEEGATLEEACNETLEILEEDGQARDFLYEYRTEEERNHKNKVLKNCQTLEKTTRDEESPVNCHFAYQGLKQAFRDDDQYKSKYSWRLAEGRGIVSTLVKLLAVRDQDWKEKDKNSDDSDDSEDEEEDEILFVQSTLEMIIMIATEGSKQARLRLPEKAFSLDEESIKIVLARLEESQYEIRIVKPLVAFIKILISQTTNREYFCEGGVVEAIELTQKMHKKNADLIDICANVVTMCTIDVVDEFSR